MKKSDSIANLSSALAKAQAEMPVVKMNAQNPFLKNKYADLGAVIETSRPILAKYGLAIIQTPVSDGDKIGVTTVLIHESGEWMEDTILITPTASKGLSDAQNAGVVISYLRRYSWSSVLGLYADEDNDGHLQKQEKADPEKVSDELWARWVELVKRAEKVRVPFPGVERAKVNASKLVELGVELKSSVEAAEKQAKAGE